MTFIRVITAFQAMLAVAVPPPLCPAAKPKTPRPGQPVLRTRRWTLYLPLLHPLPPHGPLLCLRVLLWTVVAVGVAAAERRRRLALV